MFTDSTVLHSASGVTLIMINDVLNMIKVQYFYTFLLPHIKHPEQTNFFGCTLLLFSSATGLTIDDYAMDSYGRWSRGSRGDRGGDIDGAYYDDSEEDRYTEEIGCFVGGAGRDIVERSPYGEVSLLRCAWTQDEGWEGADYICLFRSETLFPSGMYPAHRQHNIVSTTVFSQVESVRYSAVPSVSTNLDLDSTM